MDIVPFLVVAATVILVAGAGAWFVLRGLATRYRHLLAAIELSQRQLTELRLQQDELVRDRAAHEQRLAGLLENEVVARLREQIVPRLVRLERDLELRAAAESLSRTERAGKVTPETAERLRRHLDGLAEANAAGERPY